MDIGRLWTLQIMMFLLVAAGAVLKRKGILKEGGKQVLTDLVLYFFLPCNIINSFRMKFEASILVDFVWILGISIIIQILCYILSKILYKKTPKERRQVLQYCTIVSNSGFLGLPIAEGMFGAMGMMYASIFIIPMRVMMWSAGIGCFTESPDFKTVLKKIGTHPCIVAVYIGLFLLLLQQPLSGGYKYLVEQSGGFIGVIIPTAIGALDKAVQSAGGCTTAMTMVLIGMMLGDVPISSLLDRDALGISLIRLVILPMSVLIGCTILSVNPFLTGVCVLMSGMPAGSTAAILASKYGCDYVFATKCVVVSTLLSMISIPIWGMWL